MKKDRKKQVQLYLDINGKMTYDELCEKFPDVSAMTLRRDIEELERGGKQSHAVGRGTEACTR